MKKTYYDKWEFLNAIELIEIDPYETKTRLENYISKYPNDYSSYIYYSFTLISIGEFEQAENIINTTEKYASKDISFTNNPNSIHFFNYIINARIKILSYLEKYEELYNYCSKNKNKIKELNLNHSLFYSLKKVNKLDLTKREKNSYLFRQIVEYQENDFLDHIKKHLADYNIDTENPNPCIFSSNFPLNTILNEIKKYIPSDKRIFPGFCNDLYTFKYDSCGKVNNKNTDYFSVICFHNTKDIITMYPSEKREKLPYIDLNHLNPMINNSNVKKLSRIEKFNQRYKNKNCI